ncbi:McrB family protein [Stutzerimonas xanthomarina]|uniref:McrB family protein n=1 Tax=Stutzerimonas xanthomarina TaxID=271420 RepID=UPI003AA85DE1
MQEPFKKLHFDLLEKWHGQKSDSNNPEQRNDAGELKKAYEIIEKWAGALQKAIFPNGTIKLRKSPVNQGGNFFAYLWAKIYPTSSSPKELAYTVSISTTNLCVKIDTINASSNLRERYERVRNSAVEKGIVTTLSIEEGLAMSFEELVEWSVNAINDFVLSYDEVAQSIDLLKGDAQVDKDGSEQLSSVCVLGANQILYGPPGTGKTFHTIEAAVKAAEPTFEWELRAELKQEFDRLVNERRIRFVTFHQSYGYEEFVEGLKAKTEDGTIAYSVEPGVFRQMCSDAEQYQAESPAGQTYNFDTCWQAFVEYLANEDFIEIPMAKTSFRVVDFNENRIFFEKSNGKTDHTLSINTLRAIFDGSRTYTTGLGVYYRPLVSFLRELGGTDEAPATKRKNFVLVIDEINRGNISKIFGELITLIELPKRKGQPEALELTLPYSGDCFSVPDNLHIIGTMNTADRSLTMIDTALRRRFEFIEMMPKPELLDSVVVKGVNLSKLLGILNQRIEVLYDREHTLGHAFFMNVKKCLDESDYDAAFEELVHAFQNKIIPLLQEYFFDDWNKIRLVLGDNQKNESLQLILENPVSNLSLLFGQDHNIDPYDEGVIQYHLRGGKEAVWREPMTYIGMYSSTIPEQSHSESDNKLEE